MKKPIQLIILFLVVVLISECTVPGNYPTVQLDSRLLPSQRNYPNEVLATTNFKVTRGPWFDNQKFLKDMEEKRQALRNMNAPSHVMALFDSELPKNRPMEVKMASEAADGKSVFCALGFWLNPEVMINFRTGSLVLTLEGPQGKVAQVNDQGCLFLAQDNKGSPVCYDSAQQQVSFNRNFNNRPDYKKTPNVVFVRLDSSYYGWKITALALDNDKVAVQ